MDDELLLRDDKAWHDWLVENHASPDSRWLVLAKKGAAGPTSLTYAQALDEALCFGWIDGQIRKRDAATFVQRFSPRRPKSTWSRRNIDNVARLTAEGRMHPKGLEEVERAKADGRWDSAYRQRDAVMPDDLAVAIAANADAAAMAENLNAQNRFALIFRVNQAKRPQTRAMRIEQFVAMLARGETLHPQATRDQTADDGSSG